MADHALTAARVSTAPIAEVLGWLDSSTEGLTIAEAAARLNRDGPNALLTQRVSTIAVLGRQLRSALLGLLAATAALSYFLGDKTQASIIGTILGASIALGFFNEYRAERATAALHSSVHHTALVRRDGRFVQVDVADLVLGEMIRPALGEAVDFLTFGLMLAVLHAGPVEFRTGWFVESLATHTLIIFAIRTRRVPFFRSRPSGVMALTTFTVIAVGVLRRRGWPRGSPASCPRVGTPQPPSRGSIQPWRTAQLDWGLKPSIQGPMPPGESPLAQ